MTSSKIIVLGFILGFVGLFSVAFAADENGAVVIGDLSGDARGEKSLDIQSSRSADSQVVSGWFSAAFGLNNTVTGQNSVAVGLGNSVSGEGSAAVGSGNVVSSLIANPASAFGYNNTASGDRASAFGSYNNVSGLSASAFGYRNTVSASSGSAFGSGLNNDVANSTMIGPSDAAKVTILSSGNVGIGTISPASKLFIAGPNAQNYTALNGGRSHFESNATLTAANLGVVEISSTSNIGDANILTLQNGLLIFKKSGKLGIGTANPIKALDVAGSINIGNSTTKKGSGITLYDEVTGSPYCFKVRNGAITSVAGVCAN